MAHQYVAGICDIGPDEVAPRRRVPAAGAAAGYLQARQRVCADLGWRDGNADLAIVATFDDRDGWRAYVEHPDHVAAVESHIVPLVESSQSVQFTI